MKKLLMHFLPSTATSSKRRYEDLLMKFSKLETDAARTFRESTKKTNIHGESNLLFMMCMANSVKDVHAASFSKYRESNLGKTITIVGAGPSLKYYTPDKESLHIGVNGTYRKMNLDYLFLQDFEGESDTFNLDEIKELNCHKFVGRYIKRVLSELHMMAPVYIEKYIGAESYFVYDYFGRYIDYLPRPELEHFPLIDNSSSIFAAMQFALYTHPQKIRIVGCDCSNLGGQHFDGSGGAPLQLDTVAKNWIRMKEYMDVYYPDVNVESVNPIGLRGLFEDVYSEEFIRDNPLTEE